MAAAVKVTFILPGQDIDYVLDSSEGPLTCTFAAALFAACSNAPCPRRGLARDGCSRSLGPPPCSDDDFEEGAERQIAIQGVALAGFSAILQDLELNAYMPAPGTLGPTAHL